MAGAIHSFQRPNVGTSTVPLNPQPDHSSWLAARSEPCSFCRKTFWQGRVSPWPRTPFKLRVLRTRLLALLPGQEYVYTWIHIYCAIFKKERELSGSSTRKSRSKLNTSERLRGGVCLGFVSCSLLFIKRQAETGCHQNCDTLLSRITRTIQHLQQRRRDRRDCATAVRSTDPLCLVDTE